VSAPVLTDTLVAREVRRSLTWKRLAEPQADQYDSDAVLTLVAGTTTPERPTRFVRTAPFGRLSIGAVFPAEQLPPGCGTSYIDAEPGHPCIEEAIDLVRRWPAGVAQVRRLLERLHPALDLAHPAILPWDRIHSSSHSVESRFGALWATVNSAPGLAQSIVHELAHEKLCAFGVSFERADAIIANDPAECYASPLVAWPRPLTAVLHAHYALLHVTALECAILASERSRSTRRAIVRSVRRHVGLTAGSAVVIRKHVIVDAVGVPFLQSMWDWMDRLRKEVGRYAA
jgi:HEXXH motif-containing protein